MPKAARAAAAVAGLLGAAAAGALTLAPYKDVAQHVADPLSPRITVRAADGSAVPLAGTLPRGSLVVWAFATGECGEETWGPFDAGRFAAANVQAFAAAGIDYIVSTGGEAGAFSCASDEGFARFLARVDSPHLKGVDFDIERQQTPEQIDALVQRAAALHARRPQLRLSFTLATHGSADGSHRSLNATGEEVVRALRKHRLDGAAVVNLMVMNYGPADVRWCVLDKGNTACDMGASALQAAKNVHAKYGWPYARIALTAMPGENDVAGNVTTLADAQAIATGARALGLEGLHWWSIDRDRPCAAGSPRVSPHCHALPGLTPGAFGAAFGR